MIGIDPRAAQKIGPELMSGESIYWTGVPNPKVIFHSDDWTAIPNIEREGAETGTLWFGPKYTVVAAKGRKTSNISRFSVGDVRVFADIDDVNAVYNGVDD